ncbi:hypothetical protein DAPPUDRAFT_114177 [Daphnia pulex]|uniref:Uncharacterized protein n=1 Tax=Daphnia pulex TaxID=6669 RepID=E9HH99_DAPPU|nr:hypothetical protein DAPPUDRAFT_114177 [Daphnia pulex]|eukprot:EFX68825.1 hypothetical protein DAPPUDRAFT_114177 [Daphnia pulex]
MKVTVTLNSEPFNFLLFQVFMTEHFKIWMTMEVLLQRVQLRTLPPKRNQSVVECNSSANDTHSSVPSPFTESEVSYDASLEAEKSSSSFDEASHTHSDIADDEPIDNAGQSLKEKLLFMASWNMEGSIFLTCNYPWALPIFVGIDDLKLHNSSTSQFTAIFGFIPSFPTLHHLESVYFMLTLKRKTLTFWRNGENVRVKISALFCDAPARAKVTCTKEHSTYLHGCSKCTGSGVKIGQLRTNQSFRDKECGKHHHEASIEEKLFLTW